MRSTSPERRLAAVRLGGLLAVLLGGRAAPRVRRGAGCREGAARLDDAERRRPGGPPRPAGRRRAARSRRLLAWGWLSVLPSWRARWAHVRRAPAPGARVPRLVHAGWSPPPWAPPARACRRRRHHAAGVPGRTARLTRATPTSRARRAAAAGPHRGRDPARHPEASAPAHRAPRRHPLGARRGARSRRGAATPRLVDRPRGACSTAPTVRRSAPTPT